jgi:hypothetical protein
VLRTPVEQAIRINVGLPGMAPVGQGYPVK